MNEKVTCFANSSQPCSYRWKWFEWKYDILVASNSELTVAREGWHRCEAECHFGMRTCLIEAMVIHVFSPSTAGEQLKLQVVGELGIVMPMYNHADHYYREIIYYYYRYY